MKTGSFSFSWLHYARLTHAGFSLRPSLTRLLAVWGLGLFALNPASFAALSEHIAAGALFAANIVTYFEVGYFDWPASSKPLLHLWSLGVEEQFYLVFPALLFLLWRHRAAHWILAGLAVASFVLNVVTVRYDTSFAFYLPVTRFWEFLAGTMIAYGSIEPTRFAWTAGLGENSRRDNAASAIGLLMILVGVFVVPPGASFPGWWALLPVTGTVLTIWAGPYAWINRHVLARKPIVYVGLISYPLYLWHWPLLVIGKSIVTDYSPFNGHDRSTAAVAVLLSFVLSWLTFELVERPIRTRQLGMSLRQVAAAAAAVLAAVALLGIVTLKSDGLPGRYPKEIQALMTPLTWDGYPTGGFTPLPWQGYPAGNIHSLPWAASAPTKRTGLRADHSSSAFDVQLNSASERELNLLQNQRRFRFKLIKWGDCRPVDDIKPVLVEDCRKQQAAQAEELTKLKPDIVVIGAVWSWYQHVDRLGETLRFLKSIGVRRIVVLSAVPIWPQPPQSLMYVAMRSDPQHRVPDRLPTFWQYSFKYDSLVKSIAVDSGATFISLHDTFCNIRAA